LGQMLELTSEQVLASVGTCTGFGTGSGHCWLWNRYRHWLRCWL
jgi:hypothetical protein